jgi:hypothetical protein
MPKVGRMAVLLVWLGFAQHAWPQQAQVPSRGRADVSALVDAPEAHAVTAQRTPEQFVPGSIDGVVVDGDGAVCEGAHVTLAQTGPSAATVRTTASDSSGHFNFDGVAPGAFRLIVSSGGFATQTVAVVLHSGENYDAKTIVLLFHSTSSEVRVTATQVEIAQEQVKEEETQRVLGVVPNFFVSYVPDAAPLTPKQKYSMAWKTSIDPVTLVAVGAFAGIEQATNTFAGYGQGAQGYGKRYGAGFGDSLIGTMIGGAVLPSLFKQDPRYFYKGTGTTRSRLRYAIASAVMCRGDNGRREVNYAGLLGGIAAGGISNLYYPASDRSGVGLTLENALIGTAGSAVQNIFQEFVVRKLTPRLPNYGSGKP